MQETFGEILRRLREERQWSLKDLAIHLNIDISLLSKIERNERPGSKKLIEKITKIFEVDKNDLLIHFLSDRLVYEIRNEDLATEALKVAEQKIKYLKKSNCIF